MVKHTMGQGKKPARRTRKSPEKNIGARESEQEGTDALCQVQQKDKGDAVVERCWVWQRGNSW